MKAAAAWLLVGAGALGLACVVENLAPSPVLRPMPSPSVTVSATSTPTSTPTPTSTSTSTAPVAAPPPVAPFAPPGDFYSCNADPDCVAVRKVGCCDHGDKEAVNVKAVDAYAASFTCTVRPICPQFMRLETRVPQCNKTTLRCEMVKPPTP